MGKQDVKDLKTFLLPFGKEIAGLVFWLREFVWDLYPGSNELIYDNYNALAFGWSPTDRVGHTFCSIAIGRTTKNIHFGFYWGSEITDPLKLLIGNGNQYRYLLVKSKKDFPVKYVKLLIKDAYLVSINKIKDKNQIIQGRTITKSVSSLKRVKGETIKKRKNE